MQFYQNSLFIGDSQIRNLGNYFRKLRKKDTEFFPEVKCYGEYSLQMRMLARKDPLSNSVQLTYKGRDATLTSIAIAEKPCKIFILIGLNDRIYEHTDRADSYIDKIMELRDIYFADTEIYFLALTPVTNKMKPKVRDAINAYNAWLEGKCAAVGAVYMDVTAGLKDEEGWLIRKITTDAETHLNGDGFDILIRNLLDYAQAQYEAGTWIPEQQEGGQET